MPPALELEGITKSFPGVLANDHISLTLEKGEIHALLGENGAGKTTLMNILYGLYHPDEGRILVRGEPVKISSPSEAIAHGIGMVHQHFMLAGPYSALDNILLGAEPLRWGIVDRRSARERLETLARQYGLTVDWDRPIEQLPVGVQQRVEILKLLYRHAHILILDEPTAVLTPQETSDLFANLAKLRAEGKTVLLVTHKLKDVMAFTDRVTVLRAGKVTGEVETARTSPQELANLTVGRKVVLNIAVPPARPSAEPALEVAAVTLAGPKASRHRLRDVTFSVRCGEIVGVAGVEGNGQSELLQAILHPRETRCRTSGVVRILGKDVTACDTLQVRDLGRGLRQAVCLAMHDGRGLADSFPVQLALLLEADWLVALSEWIRREKLDVRSLLVIKDGKLVFERYGDGLSRDYNHELYSVTPRSAWGCRG